ncbi:surface lipoprotein assembly modifier [Desulfonema magnum]|uniref:Tetratricopeptide repeat-containing protein, DUF560 n=1 Tax=Desulfonema magnum TaxID=45655 RepID=A0A975BKS6_9BACT|nr:tetratricopeptide repeat protein [Desulfonema magnum]QTA87316.1 Tetratricopeptide repeat-containing protein, DUF560 [Desulfonema magnum]
MKKLFHFFLAGFLVLLIFLQAEAKEGRGDIYYDLGVYAYEQGKYQDAKYYFLKAIDFNPANSSYSHFLGKIYLKLGDYERAAGFLGRAARYCLKKGESYKHLSDLSYDVAYLHYKNSDFSKATELFKQVIKEDPSDVLACYYAGICLFRQERWKAAADYFNKAAEMSHSLRINSSCFAGICYFKLGQDTKAAEKLAYVRNNAPAPLRNIAEKWLLSLKAPGNARKIYDLAYQKYKASDNSGAADLFKQVIKKDPSDASAYYYGGICLFNQERWNNAADYFNKAAKINPDIRSNCDCYAGIAYLKMGNTAEAFRKLENVKDNSSSHKLRKMAETWLQDLKKQETTQAKQAVPRAEEAQEKSLRPYSLYLKAGYQHDDNIRLEPLDLDIYTNENDVVVKGFFSGTYDFVKKKDGLKIGAGYSHYQTWHNELKAYDLTGSILSLYAKYNYSPFIFGVSYLPSYYWLDSGSYLMSHQLKPEVIWKLSDRLFSRFSYSYCNDNHFQDDDKEGHTNDFFLDIRYNLFKKNSREGDRKGYFFGGIGYEDKSASHSHQDYGKYKAEMGISFDLPWHLNIGLSGKYSLKQYDNTASVYDDERDDARYFGSVSLTRKFFYNWLGCDWLGIVGEFNYTKNDSNISFYEYERRVTSLSMTAGY